jgi:hypothetical protein
MPNYMADLGDSTEGPVGCIIRVKAKDEKRALALMRRALSAAEGADVGSEGVSLRVYFNTEGITENDIELE